MSEKKDKLIEVCSECLKASCWHGEFMCDESRDAGTILKPISELANLKLEHPDNWSDKNLLAICGDAAPNGFVNEEKQKLIEHAQRIAESGCDHIPRGHCAEDCLLSGKICGTQGYFDRGASKDIAVAFLAGIAFEKGEL